MEAAAWIAAELAGAALEDARRNRRLGRVVTALGARPQASVPEASAGWTPTKATYRFWDLDTVDPAAIRAAGRPAVLARLVGEPRVLVVQDTTELRVRVVPQRPRGAPARQAGETAAGETATATAREVWVHSALAVSLEGVPLGLVDQVVWQRDPATTGKAATRRQRPIGEKESGRWLDALAATQAALPAAVPTLTVADREADIYELFAAPRRPGADLLIRAAQERCVEHEARYLWAAVAAAPPRAALRPSPCSPRVASVVLHPAPDTHPARHPTHLG